MGKCKLCNHIDRAFIETKLLTKAISYAEAGRIVGCADVSIKRHMMNHVSKAMEQVQPAIVAPITGVLDAYDLLEQSVNFCNKLSDEALKSGDLAISLSAMSEMRKTLETMSKLFEIHKKQETDLVKGKVELIVKVIR